MWRQITVVIAAVVACVAILASRALDCDARHITIGRADQKTIAEYRRSTPEGTMQTLAEVRALPTVGQHIGGRGNDFGRGSLLLRDSVSARDMELGFYAYGGGLFLDGMFEFWTHGVSVRDIDGKRHPFLDVRDIEDIAGIRVAHIDGQGYLSTTNAPGARSGGIVVGGIDGHEVPVTIRLHGEHAAPAFQVATGDNPPVFAVGADGSVLIGGGRLHTRDGALMWESPGGTVTEIAPK